MQIRFHCPHCDLPMRLSRWETLQNFQCPRCSQKLNFSVDEATSKDLKIHHCLVCGSQKLFRQKLFNRNLGIGIVVAGVIASILLEFFFKTSKFPPVLPLVIVGLIDVGLYWFLPSMIVCYHCDAEHRGFKNPLQYELYNHLVAAKAKKEPVYPGAEEAH